MAHRTVLRLVPLLLVLSACAKSVDPPPDFPVTDESISVDPEMLGIDLSPREEPEPEPPPPPPPPIQVVAGERTPLEGAPPTLRILSPRNDQLVRGERVSLRLQLRGWELAPHPGNHVHVIVDDEPYIAVRDVSASLDLGALVQENLGHALAPGTHVVRVFPSRSHHESVKEGAPFAMVVFHYRERTDGFELDRDAPMLTYSRPKGCMPSGERVMIDFYLSNVESLSANGSRVRWSIDDVSGDIVSWAPHFIENLPDGEHAVRLSLLGADGEPAAGPFNTTARTIRVGGCE